MTEMSVRFRCLIKCYICTSLSFCFWYESIASFCLLYEYVCLSLFLGEYLNTELLQRTCHRWLYVLLYIFLILDYTRLYTVVLSRVYNSIIFSCFAFFVLCMCNMFEAKYDSPRILIIDKGFKRHADDRAIIRSNYIACTVQCIKQLRVYNYSILSI